jgi:CDP-glucose 4,6-dehydratase
MARLPDASVWQGRRVLLTGHTGFKGAWLALWLARLGAHVHGFAAAPPSAPSLYELADVTSVLDDEQIGDVRAFEDDGPYDVVIHMAAQALVRRSLVDPAETWEVNVGGTARVLASGAARSASAVLVVTSDKCYRDVASGHPMLGGHDPYSASKAAQELVASSFRDTFDLPLATARAGNVIGGGDWAVDRLVPDAFRAREAGRVLQVRNPDAVRPWQHVLNPLSGYLAICEDLLAGREGAASAWNLGPEREDEWPVWRVADALDVQWERVVDPQAGQEAPVLRLDSAKARSGLGWTPVWGIADGLRATAEWYGAADGAAPRERCIRQLEEFGGA